MPCALKPQYAFVVRKRMLRPIAANVGEMLIVWPGHPTLTMCVTTPDGSTILRQIYYPEHAVGRLLFDRFLDGKIAPVSDAMADAFLGGAVEAI
jgi:hypothetical protein